MFHLETNKAIALRLVEVFNSRRLDLLEDVLHPEFRGRGISAFPPDAPEVGPAARRKLYEMFYQTIPDARAEVLDVVAEGDKVVLVDRFGGSPLKEKPLWRQRKSALASLEQVCATAGRAMPTFPP